MNKQITRKLDPHGRVSLPAHLRKSAGIAQCDTVTIELLPNGDIVMRAAGKRCCVCERRIDEPYRTIAIGEAKGEKKYVCEICAAVIVADFGKILEEGE